jgi:hypothetical protein
VMFLEVPQHPRRPARAGGCVSDGHLLHEANLITSV